MGSDWVGRFLGLAGEIDQIVVGRRRGNGGIYPNKNLLVNSMDREVDEDKRRRCCCLYRRRRVVITSKGEHDTWVMAEEGLCGRPDGTGRWGGQGMAGRDSRGHVLACCAW